MSDSRHFPILRPSFPVDFTESHEPQFPTMLLRLLTALAFLALPACRMVMKQSALPPNTLPAPRESPNIFEFYSAEEDARLADGWAASFDLSGVSFDSRKAATLVTPRHVVMANHFKRKPGARVVFHDRAGQRLVRTLTAVRKVEGDVAVGLLDQEVPSRHKIYPLPAPGTDPQRLLNQFALITDQHRRLFFHRVRAIAGSGLGFAYDKSGKHGWSKKLVSGDSGNPAFLIAGNDLILIETHSTGGPGAGPYYGNPELQKALQKTITALSPGYRLRFKSP